MNTSATLRLLDNIILAFNINGVYNIDWFNTMATEKNIINSSSIDNLKKILYDMKKEIDNIFVDVRNAFRLLSRYQKRILNIVNYIREQTPYTDMWGSKNWYSDEIEK